MNLLPSHPFRPSRSSPLDRLFAASLAGTVLPSFPSLVGRGSAGSSFSEGERVGNVFLRKNSPEGFVTG